MHAAIRHLRRAVQPTLLAAAVTFGAGLALASLAGLLGLWLGFILLSWFGKYLFVVINRVAHGIDAPVMSIEMMNPLSNWRGLGLIAIVGSVWYLTDALGAWLGANLVTALRAALLLALPATIAVLAIDGNPLKAVNPLALWRVAVGLGPWYWLVIAVAIAIGLIASIVTPAIGSRFLQFTVMLTVLLALASLLGGALYERRAQLGIDAWYSPERAAARSAKVTTSERDKFIDEVFALARNESHTNAWHAIERRLSEHAHADSEYDWLLDELARVEDPRHLERLRQQYLDRLIRGRRGGAAVKTLERIWRTAPEFRPADPATVLTLAHNAIDGGTPRVARILLQDFAERFPEHASVPVAAQLLARISR
jgi:hypothetical protein